MDITMRNGFFEEDAGNKNWLVHLQIFKVQSVNAFNIRKPLAIVQCIIEQ